MAGSSGGHPPGVSGAIEIDWQSAEVRDARLTVGFADSAPKQWVKTVKHLLERLIAPAARGARSS